jgi:hypothetical protein
VLAREHGRGVKVRMTSLRRLLYMLPKGKHF